MKSILSYLLLLTFSPGKTVFFASGFATPAANIQALSSTFTAVHRKPVVDVQENAKLTIRSSGSTCTSLQMGYNLPPGDGGGGGNKIVEAITPILTIGAIVLFFLSPLGGIFFAVTNSLFILALLTPILIGIGFNAWNYFNTIEGVCPNCGAPARVLKDIEAGPNICLSCGQLIRATQSLDGIELCNDPNDIFDEKSRVSSIFDIFTSDPTVYEETTTTTTTTYYDDEESRSKDKKRRERTIIDVDAERD